MSCCSTSVRSMMPEELHLVYKRWPRPRVEAYWNGAIFVGDDIPPMGER